MTCNYRPPVHAASGAKGYHYAVAVSANGHTLLAAGSDGILRIWLGSDGRVKHFLTPP